jgi:hypothetical protein
MRAAFRAAAKEQLLKHDAKGVSQREVEMRAILLSAELAVRHKPRTLNSKPKP